MACCNKRPCNCPPGPAGLPGPNGAVTGAWVNPGSLSQGVGITIRMDWVVVDFDAIPGNTVKVAYDVRWGPGGPSGTGTVVWEILTQPVPAGQLFGADTATGDEAPILPVGTETVLVTSPIVPTSQNNLYMSHLTPAAVPKPTGFQYVILASRLITRVGPISYLLGPRPSFFTIFPA
jgi:hypothetical protein